MVAQEKNIKSTFAGAHRQLGFVGKLVF